MWTIWLFPLLAILFLGGAAASLIWFLISSKEQRPKPATLIALPFGCVFIPIAGLILLMVVGNLMQSSDTALFEEVFGYRPTISEDRMLFDDFGRDRNRQIYMRAEPTPAERKRLLAIPDAVESDFTLDDFAGRGASEGFSWWLSTSETNPDYCKSARILDAPGFRGWEEFRIAECVDRGTRFPEDHGRIYVIATGRVIDG